MAHYLLNISMLSLKEINSVNYEYIYDDIELIKHNEKDFFSSFKKLKNIQEQWLKAIPFEKNSFLIPYNKDFQKVKYNKLHNFYFYDSALNNIKVSKVKFIITNKLAEAIGMISLIYENNNKCIFIKKIDYCKDYSLDLLKKAIISLLNYFRKTFYINNFLISIKKKNEKKEFFFRKIGFKRNINNFYKTTDYLYFWERTTKNLGKKLILTAGPSVSLSEVSKTLDAAKNGWNDNWDKYINELEQNFARYIGVRYAISTSSCTGALHIALQSLGISKGDEVIVPDITWVATARVVTYLGATPVFADIDTESWNININSVEKLISKKTKAIIPVHLYGNPANLEEIKKLTIKHNIKLIEDAAPALGSLYKGIKCGSVGDFSAFSFQGAKLIVAGEGGMICTNNFNLYKIAKKIADHGRNPTKRFWIDGPGLKYKISNIQAAFASAQLERVNHLILMKRRIFDWYKEFLKNNCNIKLLEEEKGNYSNYWMISAFLINNNNNQRDKLIKFLRNNNIDTRPVFSPISEYPIWSKKQRINKNAKLIGYSSLSFPSGTALTKKEVKYICKNINNYFNK